MKILSSSMMNQLRAILKEPTEQPQIIEGLQSGLNEEFITFADQHLLSGTLFPRIKCCSPTIQAEKTIWKKFQNRYMSQWAFNERLLTIYRELWIALKDNSLGDHVVFPGGVFFGERFHSHHAKVFVPAIELCLQTPEMIDRLTRTLSERGFVYMDSIKRLPGSGFTHSSEFRRNRFSIFLHYNRCPFLANIASKYSTVMPELYIFAGTEYPVLSPEDELTWKLLHIYRDTSYGYLRLNTFLDIHTFLQTTERIINWSSYFHKLKAEGRDMLTSRILNMVLSLFHSEHNFPRLKEALPMQRRSFLVSPHKSKYDLIEENPTAFTLIKFNLFNYPGSLLQALGWRALRAIDSHRSSHPDFAEDIIFGDLGRITGAVAMKPVLPVSKIFRSLQRLVRGGKRVFYRRFVENRHRQLFGEYYQRIQTTEKIVAITFDDGPLTPHTSRLLEVLEKHGVKATFFMLGMQAARFPSLVREVVAKGHQIGNHSYSHPHMIWMSPGRIALEIDKTDAVLTKLGVEGEILFRTPFGEQFLILPLILTLKGKKNILFDFFPTPPDWSKAPAIESANSLIEQTRPGSIIVLHDGKDAGHKVCEIVEEIIPRLKEKGYSFHTVSNLLQLSDKCKEL